MRNMNRTIELANILSRMYHTAPVGEKTTMIHLFGIKYADEIRACDASVKDIVDLSGIPDTYPTEVSKGVRLARYVMPRNNL